MPDTQTIAATVRAELGRRGLPQKSLTEPLAISAAAVSDKLRGNTPFTVEQLTRVAAFLELDIAALLAVPAEQAS